MKKILLILVGGTICSAVNGKGMLAVSEGAGVQIKTNFEKSDSYYADKAEIELSENLLILSENMTVGKWNLMIDAYRKYTREKRYDGVIFAHGTDTLAYSAALFSMILSNTDVPVFFVSANENLDSKRSNGNDNFRNAVECICRGIEPNVYVVYRNLSDGQTYLHLASRIEQCRNYSEDFYSAGMMNITGILEDNFEEYFDRIKREYPKEKRRSFIDVYGDWQLEGRVLVIFPYVGIDYDAFDYGRFSAVLHGTYHSGTACAESGENYGKSSILYMIDKCAERGVDTYFSPSKLTGEVYETMGIIGEHTAPKNYKIKFLYGCTTEAAYAKLVLAYSVFKDKSEIAKFIDTECNFENIVK